MDNMPEKTHLYSNVHVAEKCQLSVAAWVSHSKLTFCKALVKLCFERACNSLPTNLMVTSN